MGFSEKFKPYKSSSRPSLDHVLEEVSLRRGEQCGEHNKENLISLEIAEAAYVRTLMLNAVGLPDSETVQAQRKSDYELKLAEQLALEKGGEASKYQAQARVLSGQARNITHSMMSLTV